MRAVPVGQPEELFRIVFFEGAQPEVRELGRKRP